jgi:hypothetical protein
MPKRAKSNATTEPGTKRSKQGSIGEEGSNGKEDDGQNAATNTSMPADWSQRLNTPTTTSETNLKLVTWNVNSLSASMKKGSFVRFAVRLC